MVLDIRPWVGLGPLRFGQTRKEVRAAFNERETYQDWMGGNLNDELLYADLILGFGEDSRFCEVFARPRADLRLFGRQLTAWMREALAAYIAQRNWHARLSLSQWEMSQRLSSPRPHMHVDDLALGIQFDEAGHVTLVEFFEPGLRIIKVHRRGRSEDLNVVFQGGPLREEYRCIRTEERWKYVGVTGALVGAGPYKGTLRSIERGAELRRDDILVPTCDPPVVPLSPVDAEGL
jgi:hypothetical protein